MRETTHSQAATTEVDQTATQVDKTTSFPKETTQPVPSEPLKKESKIRVDDDTPPKPRSTGDRVESHQPAAALQLKPLAEWEQASVMAALATEDQKEGKKDDKSPLPVIRVFAPLPGAEPIAYAMESGVVPTSKPPGYGLESDVLPTSVSSPSATGIQFPALRRALQINYLKASHLKLPLSEQYFPIKDVSLTISDKSEQDQREKERRLAEEKARQAEKEKQESKEKTDPKESKTKDKENKEEKESKKGKKDEFWSERFRLEEEWHRISQPIAVKDIFTIEGSTTSVRRILVEGRAGVGKTTFSQYVAHQWAQQNLFAGQFDYVFWIPLRQCLSIEDPTTQSPASMEVHLAKFIFQHIMLSLASGGTLVRRKDIQTVLSSGSNARTLLILDGFDEVAQHLASESRPFYGVLKDLLEFPNIIITTRDYQTPPARVSFDRRLVNIGFTDQQISAYIHSYCAFVAKSSKKPDHKIQDEELSGKEKEKDTDKKEGKVGSKTTSSLATRTPAALSALQHAKALESALKQNPRFWGLAHIPLNLALICESWSGLQSTTSVKDIRLLAEPGTPNKFVEEAKRKTAAYTIVHEDLSTASSPKSAGVAGIWKKSREDKDSKTTLDQSSDGANSLNLVYLYQNVLTCFLRRDAAKYRASATLTTFAELSKSYALELVSLGALAWQGMQAQQQIISADLLQKALNAVQMDYAEQDKVKLKKWNKAKPEELEKTFTQALQLGLLRDDSTDTRLPLLKRPYYFIHLTFQEYFAAWYVLQALQGRHGQKAYTEAVTWLGQHKYEPRHAVLVGFLAGLTTQADYDQALNSFWHALCSAPLDVVGVAHTQLMMRCLAEANWDSRIPGRAALLKTLRKWLDGWIIAEFKVIRGKSDMSWLREGLAHYSQVSQHCAWRLPQSIVKALKDEDWPVREAGIRALGQLGTSLATTPESLQAVLTAAKDEDGNVREAGVWALGQLGTSLTTTPPALQAVLTAAKDEDGSVRETAVSVLGQLGTSLAATLESLQAVLIAAKDKKENVRRAAIRTLSQLGATLVTMPESLQAVLTAAKDEEGSVREAAVSVLGQMTESLVTTPDALHTVLTAAKDKNEDVRRAVRQALGQLGASLARQPKALHTVLSTAKDKNEYVRGAAISALGQLGASLATTPEALHTVLTAAKDKNEYVRWTARQALGQLGASLATQPKALHTVLTRAKDKNEYIRGAAILALSQLGASLATMPEVLHTVLITAKDKDWNVRRAARQALGQLGASLATTPEALHTVLTAAKDEKEDVRRAALLALAQLGASLATTPMVLHTVLSTAKDEDGNVREAAISALGQLGASLATTPEALHTVLTAVKDENEDVRETARQALAHLGASLSTTPKALQMLLTTAKDEDENVRLAVISALGQLGASLATIPEVLHTVLTAVKDRNEYVRLAAIRALGQLGASLSTTPGALHTVLTAAKDKNKYLRKAAISALGQLGASLAATPEALQTVLAAIKDEIKGVQQVAEKILQMLDFIPLMQGYLAEETRRQTKRMTFGQNLYLPILLRVISNRSPSISLDGHTLRVASGSDSEIFHLSSPERVHPLVEAIERKQAKHGLPALSLRDATGQKTWLSLRRRTLVPKPDFKVAMPFDLQPGFARQKTALAPLALISRLNTRGQITLDFTVDYEDLDIEEELSRGAAGKVSRGKYNAETVAIKEFHHVDFSSEKHHEILNEASAMATIQSQHLVRLMGICLEKSHYAVVMEYLPKGDLYCLLQDKGKSLLWAQRYRLAADIAIGLKHLHGRNILHRDLKSLNVLLYEANGELRAKVSDFGMAALKQTVENNDEGFFGTMLWADPELIRKTGQYSQATDMYSFGMILYELATREVPYYHIKGSRKDVEDQIFAGKLPVLPEDCPSGLANLIQQCWSKNPKARPAALVVVKALEALYQAEKGGTVGHTAESSSETAAPPLEKSLESELYGVESGVVPPESNEPMIYGFESGVLPSADSKGASLVEPTPTISPMEDSASRDEHGLQKAKIETSALPTEPLLGTSLEETKRISTSEVTDVETRRAQLDSAQTLAKFGSSTSVASFPTPVTAPKREEKTTRLPTVPGIAFLSPSGTIPKSWLQPDTILKPGEGRVCLAQPKTGGAPQIYMETASAQGKRKLYAYALKVEEDGTFNYQREEMNDGTKLLGLSSTHTLSLHMTTDQQNKNVQLYLADQEDKIIAAKFYHESGGVNWAKWYEALLMDRGICTPSTTVASAPLTTG